MPDNFAIAERTATLLALVLLLGAAIFRLRVLRPMLALAMPGDVRDDFAARVDTIARNVAAAAAVMLVVLAGVRLHMQVVAIFESWNAATSADIRALLLGSMWGRAWLLQLVCAASVASGPYLRRPLDAWFAVPLAFSASMNGHAAGVTGVGPLAISADALHVLGAGGWAGGVFFVFVATRVATNPRELLATVQGFSRVALTSAAVLAITGVFAAFLHLNNVGELLTTPYGARLVVKMVFVTAMAAVGAWNWRRSTPALAAGDPRALRVGVTIELFIAVTIVLSTARLVLTSPPEPVP